MDRIPRDVMLRTAGNRLSPGFGASLAWLHEVEPQVLERARAAIQPKDFVALRLTGEVGSEPSDASATWLYDIARREWSPTLAGACNVPVDILPPVAESAAVVGALRAEAAFALGLPEGIPVVAGAADQAALLLGVGVVESGRGSITLGTGGQLTVVTNRPWIDPEMRLNTFCHAIPDHWYTRWRLQRRDRPALQAQHDLRQPVLQRSGRRSVGVPAGADGLIFLPYLEGERTPAHGSPGGGRLRRLDHAPHPGSPDARCAGGRGVCLPRLSADLFQATGPVPDHFSIGGGGSQSELWRRIMADVLGVSLQTIEGAEHTPSARPCWPGWAHTFYDLPQAVATSVRYGPTLMLDHAAHAAYTDIFAGYQALYPALRSARQ